MKLFLGKKLVTNTIKTFLDISSFEEVLKISKEVASVEEAVIEYAIAYYNNNLTKVNAFLNNIPEDDIQKAHNLVKKVLSYRPEWDSELNLTVTFDEEV